MLELQVPGFFKRFGSTLNVCYYLPPFCFLRSTITTRSKACSHTRKLPEENVKLVKKVVGNILAIGIYGFATLITISDPTTSNP